LALLREEKPRRLHRRHAGAEASAMLEPQLYWGVSTAGGLGER